MYIYICIYVYICQCLWYQCVYVSTLSTRNRVVKWQCSLIMPLTTPHGHAQCVCVDGVYLCMCRYCLGVRVSKWQCSVGMQLNRSRDLPLSAIAHTATHCITPQHTATHCNMYMVRIGSRDSRDLPLGAILRPLHHAVNRAFSHLKMLRVVLQYVVVCCSVCNTLQHTATL